MLGCYFPYYYHIQPVPGTGISLDLLLVRTLLLLGSLFSSSYSFLTGPGSQLLTATTITSITEYEVLGGTPYYAPDSDLAK